MVDLTIRPYDNDSDSARVSTLWQETFPQYPISPQHLETLLTLRLGTHFVALVENKLIGFCATYREPLTEEETGYLAVIAVHSELHGKGYGTKLFEHVMDHLRKSFKKIKAGSSIPRFWPGVPTDVSIKDQEFFVKRGKQICNLLLYMIHLTVMIGFKEGTKCKDLYQPLSAFKPPQYLLDRATSSGITFAPLTSSGAEECITAQEAIFPQWAGAYKMLHSGGFHDEIMVAFDQNGSRQVGWTLMLSPGKSKLWQGFAFLPFVGGDDTNGETGGKGKTGLIAAVGVREDVRGKGAGLGLICAAMEELRGRGQVDGVFIDSVVLGNFYEKVGFKIWREYRTFTMER